MAMVLHSVLPNRQTHDARILATDIDTDMIARAAGGRYPTAAGATIPASYAQRWAGADGTIDMKSELRRLITFKPLNLLQPWPMRGPFDAIFCRNVAIYFDTDTKRALFDRFANILCDGGWLYVGHSESLNGISERFRLVGRTTYRRIA